eukprot:TRINITY_DN7582_c0_g1_i4.p1 TRINITY_DN7582_c0_g1~~TRINITY_DN7582_c0_g1_i4.p1  ORF type:complete len:466 (-),score=65.40 TRINITY_DN7582_c0_g1_i4:67-1464(-)
MADTSNLSEDAYAVNDTVITISHKQYEQENEEEQEKPFRLPAMIAWMVPENFCEKVKGLPRNWALPFLKDYIFYAVLITISSSAFRYLMEPFDYASRIVVANASIFCWAWILIILYMTLQCFNFFRRYLVTEGKVSDDLRELYHLPSHFEEKVGFWECAPNVLRNQVFYFGVSGLIFYFATPHKWQAPPASLSEVLISVVVYMLSFDVLIYIGHRILHEHLYHLHRQHHSTFATVPCSGWYMTFVDFLIELMIPIFLPPLVGGANWLTLWTWLFLIEWDGVHTHAGFDFWPGVIPGPTRHWLHHMMYCCNYSTGLTDYFYGTEAPEKDKDENRMSSQKDKDFAAEDDEKKWPLLKPRLDSAKSVSTTAASTSDTVGTNGAGGEGSFTMAEVAKHRSRGNCWVVLHGKVLDVSNFLPKHPGGENVLLMSAGKDVTKMFEDIHSSSGGFALVGVWAPNAVIGTVVGA